MSLSSGCILGDQWRVSGIVGEGACAKVYEVNTISKSTKLAYDVVAKCIPLGKPGGKSIKDKELNRICNTLHYEYTLYCNILFDFEYAPRRPEKFYGNDLTANMRYLVMERLQTDLSGLARSTCLAPADVSRLGLQILGGLSALHLKSYLFIDVKPENFMLKNEKLYFVDFGLAERIATADWKERFKLNGPRSFAGTPTFCSIHVHRGGAPSQVDDLLAMVYVLLSLFSGAKLPWSTAKSQEQCLAMKEAANIRDMCTAVNCPELADIFDLCSTLREGELPDYDQIAAYLTQLSNKPASSSEATYASKSGRGKARSITKVGINTEVIDLCGEDTSHIRSSASSSKLTPQKREKSPPQQPVTVDLNDGGENDQPSKRSGHKAAETTVEPPKQVMKTHEPDISIAAQSSALLPTPRRKTLKAMSTLPSIDESSVAGPFSSSMGSGHNDLHITAPEISKVLNPTLSASLMRLKGRQRGGGTATFTAEVTAGAHLGMNLLFYPSQNDLVIGSSKSSFLCLEHDNEVVAEHVSINVDASEGLTLRALEKSVSLRGYACRTNRVYHLNNEDVLEIGSTKIVFRCV